MRLKSILAASFAALLALTGCSGGEDEKSLTEQNEERLAALSFSSPDELKDHLSGEDYENVDVYLDETGGIMDGNLDVGVDSAGTKLQDQNLTADIIETVAHGVEFDYDNRHRRNPRRPRLVRQSLRP